MTRDADDKFTLFEKVWGSIGLLGFAASFAFVLAFVFIR